MQSPVERFLARFETFGQAPSVLALLHPEATLFDAGTVFLEANP